MSNHPSQFAPDKFGVFRIWFDPDEWSRDQREWIGLGVFAARKVGPDVIWTAHEADADVTLHRWISDEDGGPIGAGLYSESLRRIQIDPVGCHGELEFRTAVTHEVLHFFGCEHVGRAKGRAVLNPDVNDPDGGPITADATVTFPVAVVDVTQLDVDAFNHAVRLGRLPVPRHMAPS